MELITKLSWGALALIHLTPSLPIFRPNMIEKLYGADPAGDLGLLMTHRSGLFLAVFVATLFAIFNDEARRLATIVVGISMISFLVLYLQAGLPGGPLQKIAIADAIGIVPLALVIWQAWLHQSA